MRNPYLYVLVLFRPTYVCALHTFLLAVLKYDYEKKIANTVFNFIRNNNMFLVVVYCGVFTMVLMNGK